MLTVGFFLTLGFLQKFDLTHLWFLHQLLVIYALALGIRFAFCRLPDRGRRLLDGLDRAVRAVFSSRWQVPALTMLSLPFLYYQRGWSVDTPKESLIPELPSTFLFGLLFAVGWALHRQTGLLDSIAGRWKPHLILGVLLIAPTRFLTWHLYDLGLFDQYHNPIRLGHYVLYGLMMWAFVFGFLGLFVRYRRKESRAWRYIADSSYWIYIAHLPIVVSLQVWVAHWPLHWSIKFLIINLIAFPLLFLSYHFLVRPTLIGKQLNGRRYPLVLPFRKQDSPPH
jgi:peptidoglycan/LPS O-acetylase OafA/YrhL